MPLKEIGEYNLPRSMEREIWLFAAKEWDEGRVADKGLLIKLEVEWNNCQEYMRRAYIKIRAAELAAAQISRLEKNKPKVTNDSYQCEIGEHNLSSSKERAIWLFAAKEWDGGRVADKGLLIKLEVEWNNCQEYMRRAYIKIRAAELAAAYAQREKNKSKITNDSYQGEISNLPAAIVQPDPAAYQTVIQAPQTKTATHAAQSRLAGFQTETHVAESRSDEPHSLPCANQAVPVSMGASEIRQLPQAPAIKKTISWANVFLFSLVVEIIGLVAKVDFLSMLAVFVMIIAAFAILVGMVMDGGRAAKNKVLAAYASANKAGQERGEASIHSNEVLARPPAIPSSPLSRESGLANEGPAPQPPPAAPLPPRVVCWVYVLRCPAHAKNVYKVGYTDRDPYLRCDEISRATASPVPFLVVEAWTVSNGKAAEAAAHKALARLRMNKSREFFLADYPVIRKAIETAISNWAI